MWFERFQISKRKQKHQNAQFIDEKLKTKSLMFFVSFFFHVICKILNSSVRIAFNASFLYWVYFTWLMKKSNATSKKALALLYNCRTVRRPLQVRFLFHLHKSTKIIVHMYLETEKVKNKPYFPQMNRSLNGASFESPDSNTSFKFVYESTKTSSK